MMKAKQLRKIVLSLGLGLILFGCASSAVKTSWRDQQKQLRDYPKVMVMLIAQNDVYQRAFEDHCISMWKEYGVTGMPSYAAFPGKAQHDKAAMAQYLTSQGIGAILVVQMKGSDTMSVTTAAVTTVQYDDPRHGGGYGGGGHGGGYYNFYQTSHRTTHQPATTTEYDLTTIEARLFDTKTAAAIGIVETETVIEKKSAVVTSQIQELAKIITQELVK